MSATENVADVTEGLRRALQAELNAVQAERDVLEAEHGRIWNTTELVTDYEVQGFMAPFVVVKRKADGAVGSLAFQHYPRFYFDWAAD
jgi:hypothetical protein